MGKIRAMFSAAALAALTACGGGANALQTPSGSAVVPVSALSGSAKVTLAIKIPAMSSLPPALRKPTYVSPSTLSIGGTISPAVGCTTCSPAVTIASNLTATSNGCAASSGGTTCSLQFSLNPGTYTATLTTYDQINQNGNQLSANQGVAIYVVGGQNNVLSLTLQGVPAGYKVTALSPGVSSRLDPKTTGFDDNLVTDELMIDGVGTQAAFAVSPVDADGNVIVGAGAPTVSLSAHGAWWGTSFNAATNVLTVTTPSKATLATPGQQLYVNYLMVKITSTLCASTSACSGMVGEVVSPIVAVGDDVANLVQVFNMRTQAKLATFQSVANPRCVAFDAGGDVFIGSANSNTGNEYAPPYTGAAQRTITAGLDGCSTATYDYQGNLYVADATPNYSAVVEYAPGTTSALTLTTGLSSPQGLAVSSAGYLWVTNQNPIVSSVYAVNWYAPPLSNSPNYITTGISEPNGIAYDSLQDCVVVANAGGSALDYYYATTGASCGTSALSFNPGFVAVSPGPAGYVFAVGTTKFAFPSGTGPYTVTPGFNNIFAVAADDVDTVYVADHGAGKLYMGSIGKYSSLAPFGGFTSPARIATWPREF